jgi:hypothetical protein
VFYGCILARDRKTMQDEIIRLRRQFSLDLEMVARELREAKLELQRLRLINLSPIVNIATYRGGCTDGGCLVHRFHETNHMGRIQFY